MNNESSNRHPTELSDVGLTNEKLIDGLQYNLATTKLPWGTDCFGSYVNRPTVYKLKCKSKNYTTNTVEQQQVVGPECSNVRHLRLWQSLDDNTAEQTLEKVRKLNEEKWLWTGEYVYCICTHHVEQHCTIRDKCGFVVTIHCHGNNDLCVCEHFRTQRLRIANEDGVI